MHTPRAPQNISLHVLHLDLIHDPLLALGKGDIGQNIRVVSVAPPELGVRIGAAAAAAADGAEALRGLVLVVGGALRGRAEEGSEPGFEEGEDHGEVGGYDGDEGFAGTPCAGELGAVDVVLGAG